MTELGLQAVEADELGEQIYKRLPTEIFVRPDRHRQKFNRKTLDNLVESMREVGQLQPGVCRINPEGLIELLIGERRLRACIVLHQSFRYYLKEKITNPLLLEQIQLDENLQRENLDWREEIKAKARLHGILVEMYGEAQSGIVGGHTLHMTAEHIGVKKSILQEDVTLAGFLSVPEVEVAPNKTTAKKIVKRMIEQVQRHEQLAVALAVAKQSTVEDQTPLTESARAEVKAKEMEARARRELTGEPEPEDPKTILEQQLIYYNKRCILGKMEEKIQSFADESFDIVCFDPPWGVDFDANKKESVGVKDYKDSAENYSENLEHWLTLIYQKLKPNSHLYMFAAISRIGFTYDILEKVGFITHRIPIIWWKKGAHATRTPHKWPGQAYEPIAFVHKGGKKNLVKLGAANVIETPMPTPAIKDIHPSAKHPKIYREILSRSASPSDTILDPMAGSGMFAVAAEHLQKTHALNWFQIEMDADFRNLELLNLAKGYEAICRGSGTEQSHEETYAHQDWEAEALPSDFKQLKPGTPEWVRYWNEHPDKQDDMLAWRVSGGG